MTSLKKLHAFCTKLEHYPSRLAIQQEIERLLAEEQKPAAGYWWCQNCVKEIHPSRVTFEETHDACGARVEWMDAPCQDCKNDDTALLNGLQALMTPGDNYCEIYLAGLRNAKDGKTLDASAFQVESQPTTFPTVDAPTLREAIRMALSGGKP